MLCGSEHFLIPPLWFPHSVRRKDKSFLPLMVLMTWEAELCFKSAGSDAVSWVSHFSPRRKQKCCHFPLCHCLQTKRNTKDACNVISLYSQASALAPVDGYRCENKSIKYNSNQQQQPIALPADPRQNSTPWARGHPLLIMEGVLFLYRDLYRNLSEIMQLYQRSRCTERRMMLGNSRAANSTTVDSGQPQASGLPC